MGHETGRDDLGLSWRCKHHPSKEIEERGFPVPPTHNSPWDFLPLATPRGPWLLGGCRGAGLDFWGDEYSSALAGLCFCLLSREGLGFRFTLTPGGSASRYPLPHLFLLHLLHSCSYPAHLAPASTGSAPWRHPQLPQPSSQAASTLSSFSREGLSLQPAAVGLQVQAARGWVRKRGHSQAPHSVSTADKSRGEGERRHARSHLSPGEQAEFRLIPLASWRPSRPPAELLLGKFHPRAILY